MHGDRDIPACYADRTAWELAAAWPDATLLIDDETGHRGGGSIKRQWLLSALDGFADHNDLLTGSNDPVSS